MVVLALDIATDLGWALYIPGNKILSGVQDLQPKRFDGGGMRYLYFRRWLDEVHQDSGGISEVY